MALPPRDAIDKILFFQQEVNRLFKGIFGEDPHVAAPPTGLRVPVHVDVAEKEEQIIYEISLPGIDFSDIKLHVSSDIIVVEGVKPRSEEVEKGTYLCVERSFGTFRRLLEIPMPVDSRNAQAVFKHGVLRVVLQKISDRRGLKREVAIEQSNDKNSE